jgi:hypothetical protein
MLNAALSEVALKRACLFVVAACSFSTFAAAQPAADDQPPPLLQQATISPNREVPDGGSRPGAMLWAAAASGLMFAGLVLGAIATWVVLDERHNPDSRMSSGSLTAAAFKHRFVAAASRISATLPAVIARSKAALRRAGQQTNARLRRLIPSRRLVLRTACFVAGTALVLLSLVGFSTGRILESSIILPTGYAIAVCGWLLPWNRPRAVAVNQPAARSKIAVSSFSRSWPPASAVPPAVAINDSISEPLPPASGLGFACDTIDQRRLDYAICSPAIPPGTAAHLVCSPCGKQFTLRGEGDIGLRLIPCPQCGSALEAIGAKQPPIALEPGWMPIVSVLCKGCRSLIDVPYSSFGTSIPCPRCHADLTVPTLKQSAAHPGQKSSPLPV